MGTLTANFIFMKHAYKLFIIVLSVFCMICFQSKSVASVNTVEPDFCESTPKLTEDRNLKITVSASNKTNYFKIFSPDHLNHNMTYPLIYSELRSVSIEIDGNIVNLEDAIRDNMISLSEIFYFTRLDTAAGFCTETFESHNGLTSFYYTYDDFIIKLVYDVYETPDGKQHLISDMQIYKPGAVCPRIYSDESGNFIDREDWGLVFEVEAVTPTGITLKCMQSGGQQIGELQISNFQIFIADDTIKNLNSSEETHPSIPIQSNSESGLLLNWSHTYGELPTGEYMLRLAVEDIYSVQHLHPLMQNFYDLQYYSIPFAIP